MLGRMGALGSPAWCGSVSGSFLKLGCLGWAQRRPFPGMAPCQGLSATETTREGRNISLGRKVLRGRAALGELRVREMERWQQRLARRAVRVRTGRWAM